MSRSAPKTVLLLEGTELPREAQRTFAVAPPCAASALEAATLLVTSKPDVVLVRADVAWHRGFVEALPAAERPAILATGSAPPEVGFADEWLGANPSQDEVAHRFDLALERARERRRTARRTWADALTGLPNRRAFVQTLARSAASARRTQANLALVLLDLDGFKAVNETEGHLAGDRVLRKVGAALLAAVRSDELCGRVGGDEFALLVSGDERAADKAARRMTDVIRGLGLSATAAVGVYHPTERLQELYRRTDDLLRQSKARRRLLGALPAGTARRQSMTLRVQPATPDPMAQQHGSRIELHIVDAKDRGVR